MAACRRTRASFALRGTGHSSRLQVRLREMSQAGMPIVPPPAGRPQDPVQRSIRVSLQFSVGDLTIHRIIEQETTFLPALDLLPALTPGVLSENRAWMQRAGALDADDVLILCFQSYVVKTPHHTI